MKQRLLGRFCKKESGLWKTGKTWGIRLYATGRDPGDRANHSQPEISQDCLDTWPLSAHWLTKLTVTGAAHINIRELTKG